MRVLDEGRAQHSKTSGVSARGDKTPAISVRLPLVDIDVCTFCPRQSELGWEACRYRPH